MRDKPDAEVDPPLFLKVLGLLMGTCFAAVALLMARDALGKPFAASSWLLVSVLLLFAWTFVGLLVWRKRLYVQGDVMVIERRGYFGVTRRSFSVSDVELTLDRDATWGLFAKATVPRFVVRARDGEVLLDDQYMGVEQLAERLAKKVNRPLRGV